MNEPNPKSEPEKETPPARTAERREEEVAAARRALLRWFEREIARVRSRSAVR